MPTTYAHYKFGEELKKKAVPAVLHPIRKHPELFQIGLHGPDILFYYKIFQKNHINRIGSHMHTLPGKDFFEKAAAVIRKSGFEQAYLAYTLGFLCHFVLDVTCHEYVNRKAAEGPSDHLEIEAFFDRELLLRDGKNPMTAILTNHLKAKKEHAKVISNFFEDVTEDEIETSLKDMIFLLNLLVPGGKVKSSILDLGLKLTGKYESYQGLIIKKEGKKELEPVMVHLLELFETAKERMLRLSEEYVDYLYGKGELDIIYHWNFDSVLREGKEK